LDVGVSTLRLWRSTRAEKAEKTAEKKTEEYTEELLNFMAIQCEHH
jgi:hypothetical protein